MGHRVWDNGTWGRDMGQGAVGRGQGQGHGMGYWEWGMGHGYSFGTDYCAGLNRIKAHLSRIERNIYFYWVEVSGFEWDWGNWVWLSVIVHWDYVRLSRVEWGLENSCYTRNARFKRDYRNTRISAQSQIEPRHRPYIILPTWVN